MTPHAYTPEYFAARDASPLFAFELAALAEGISGRRVLEVGCGRGTLGQHVRDAGAASYVGTDLVAQPGAEPDLICDAASIPIADSTVDLLLSQHVVEHLEDPTGFFLEAKRVLTPGGCLRFTTPNARYPQPELFDDPTHVSVHDAAWWEHALRACGYIDVKLRTLFPYLGHPVFLYQSVIVSRRLTSVGRIGLVIFADARVPE